MLSRRRHVQREQQRATEQEMHKLVVGVQGEGFAVELHGAYELPAGFGELPPCQHDPSLFMRRKPHRRVVEKRARRVELTQVDGKLALLRPDPYAVACLVGISVRHRTRRIEL